MSDENEPNKNKTGVMADILKQANTQSYRVMADSLKSLGGYKPPLSLANIAKISMPKITPINLDLIKLPTPKEQNNYQSAAVLMKELANTVSTWRGQVPEGIQPAVIAILNGGIQINVTSLAQVSFHGIRVEGTINELPCMVLAHQNTIQLLCYAEPIKSPETPRRKIGFIIDGEQSEA